MGLDDPWTMLINYFLVFVSKNSTMQNAFSSNFSDVPCLFPARKIKINGRYVRKRANHKNSAYAFLFIAASDVYDNRENLFIEV